MVQAVSLEKHDREGYASMARDEMREREAHEWSEGLLGDTTYAIKVQLGL